MTMMIGKFCWNELATTDAKAAQHFYSAVLGWKFSEQKMGDMTYTKISHFLLLTQQPKN